MSRTHPLTAARLREVLKYDPETGLFTWLLAVSRKVVPGRVAGRIRSDGYACIKVDGVCYLQHRLAWFYVTGGWPKSQIDHINRMRSDNRIQNLREATPYENMQNIDCAQINNRVGMRGVVAVPSGRFAAFISKDRKTRYIGTFDTAGLANEARLLTKANMHPFHVPTK